MGKVEKVRKILATTVRMSGIGQASIGISQLIKEWVYHRFDCRESLCGRVLEQARDQIDRVWIRLAENLGRYKCPILGLPARYAYLAERMRLDLREFVLHVVRIHRTDLVTRRRSQNFDDLDQLVNARFSWEKWLPKHQLSHDATSRPDI